MSNPTDFNTEYNKRLEAIQFAASSQQDANDKLRLDFLKAQESGIYYYLTNIPIETAFMYFMIFIVSFFIINQVGFTIKHIIVLIMSVGIIFLLNEKRRSTNVTKMQEYELKLNSIFPKPKYFYVDAGIINLIWSIQEYRNYNPSVHSKLIRVLDDFLSYTIEVEKNIENGYPMYEVMQNFKDIALNHLESFIFTVPTDLAAENKLDDATISLHRILNFHLEKIRIKLNEDFNSGKPSIDKRIIHRRDAPKPKDELFNPHYDMF